MKGLETGSEAAVSALEETVNSLQKDIFERDERAAADRINSDVLKTELAELHTEIDVVRSERSDLAQKLEDALKEVTEKLGAIRNLGVDVESKTLFAGEVEEKSKLALEAAHSEISVLSEKLYSRLKRKTFAQRLY